MTRQTATARRLIGGTYHIIFRRAAAPDQISKGRSLVATAWQAASPALMCRNNFHSTTKLATETKRYAGAPAETSPGRDEYDAIMKDPTIHPSESVLVVDQHFDDLADGGDPNDDREDDGRPREIRVMSATKTASASATSDARGPRFEYDYDEYQLHMSPSEANKVDHEHLSSLDMLGHDDVVDVREQRRAWQKSEQDEELGGDKLIDENLWIKEPNFEEFEEDWELLHSRANSKDIRADDNDTVIDW